MKTMIRFLALVLGLALCGCNSLNKLQPFLDKLPATELASAKQTMNAPFWRNEIAVKDVTTDADGLLDVGEVMISVGIPLIGVVSTFETTGFKQIPTAKQRAAAAAVKAAAKAARAEAAAAKAKAASETAAAAAAKTP